MSTGLPLCSFLGVSKSSTPQYEHKTKAIRAGAFQGCSKSEGLTALTLECRKSVERPGGVIAFEGSPRRTPCAQPERTPALQKQGSSFSRLPWRTHGAPLWTASHPGLTWRRPNPRKPYQSKVASATQSVEAAPFAPNFLLFLGCQGVSKLQQQCRTAR